MSIKDVERPGGRLNAAYTLVCTHLTIGDMPLAEAEATYYWQLAGQAASVV